MNRSNSSFRITKIRKEDVAAAEKIGAKIKLLGRCIIDGENVTVLVAPFMLSASSALSGVSGVYNAVEVVGEPIGNVMFYGQGAGAGATASAVVGDLMQIMRSGTSCKAPSFKRSEYNKDSFLAFKSQSYFAVRGVDADTVRKIFGNIEIIPSEELSFVSASLSEAEIQALCAEIVSLGGEILSRIRLL